LEKLSENLEVKHPQLRPKSSIYPSEEKEKPLENPEMEKLRKELEKNEGTI